MAIGSLASQSQVVRPCFLHLPSSLPLATASSPAGTVTLKVKEALSVGWSFAGNHVAATCGSPAMIIPSSVANTPLTPNASTTGSGMPE